MFEFLTLHPKGIVLFTAIILLLGGIVNFPGGHPKQLWWTCAGVCVIACTGIIWGFSLLIGSMSIPPEYQKTPAVNPTTRAEENVGGPKFHEDQQFLTAKIGDGGYVTKQIDKSNVNPQQMPVMRITTPTGEKVTPFSVQVENGMIFIDAEFFDGLHRVQLKKNVLVGKPLGWDFNYNDSASELVDDAGNPVFQLIYENPSTVVLKGAFYVGNDQMFIANHNVSIVPTSEGLQLRSELRPIFKHPRWKYPGMFADDSHANAAGLPDAVDFSSQGKGSTGPVKLANTRKFKSLPQILKAFPQKYIPTNGKWPLSNEAANSTLQRKVVGREAQVSIEVEFSHRHPDGPYANVAFIVGRFTEHQIINLPLLFYAYFNKATPEQAEAVLASRRHDRVHIAGRIVRADLTNRPDKGGVVLNIDLNDCEFVKP